MDTYDGEKQQYTSLECNDYAMESIHFIFDGSLRSYLKDNISPEKFNNYMNRMDQAYNAMLDLVGRTPCDGEKIIIRDGKKDGIQWVTHQEGKYGRYINWGHNYIIPILVQINYDPDDWWLVGSIHELGHLFDDDGNKKWVFSKEGMATYKAWLAIEKCSGKVCCSNNHVNCFYEKPLIYNWDKNLSDHKKGSYDSSGPYTYRRFLSDAEKSNVYIDLIKYIYEDDIVYLFNPIINELGFNETWEIFKKVFRSYYNNSYSPKSYTGSQEQKNVADFLDRCSYFVSQYIGRTTDIKNYWMKETKTHYEENITN